MSNVVFEVNGSNVTLVTRTVSCGELSREDFIAMVMEDMQAAEKQYAEVVVTKMIDNRLKNINDAHDSTLAKATERAQAFAESKWKTERYRNAYVLKSIANFLETEQAQINRVKNMKEKLDFFDFDPNCGTYQGINCRCILHTDADAETVSACFDVMQNSEYFKVATGWELTYMKSGSSLRSGFRPQIKLILPVEVQEEATKSAESLARAISDYYASKKSGEYCGD